MYLLDSYLLRQASLQNLLFFYIFQENHKYYVSEIIKKGQKYWIDVLGNKNHKVHLLLSDSYLLRQVSLHGIIIKIMLTLFL